MQPDLGKRVDCFAALGEIFRKTAVQLAHAGEPGNDGSGLLYKSAMATYRENPWFTPRETSRALASLGQMLAPGKLHNWLQAYPEIQLRRKQKMIGVVMAGNIPLVGFHDMLSVLASGHRLLAKCSSQDPFLPVTVAKLLAGLDKKFEDDIFFSEDLQGADAVIATGSDNTARYFSWHYGHIPHIIRKNRNSMAILTGHEAAGEISALGEDIFAYFGRGCRNVSHILLPSGYDAEKLCNYWSTYRYVTDNDPYVNNIRYQRAYYLASKTCFHDHDFFIMRESRALSSPVGVIHYSFYSSREDALEFTEHHEGSLQCVVGHDPLKMIKNDMVSPGHSQHPGLRDYADNVDTLRFLLDLG